jgi:hypothetical protein
MSQRTIPATDVALARRSDIGLNPHYASESGRSPARSLEVGDGTGTSIPTPDRGTASRLGQKHSGREIVDGDVARIPAN